MPRVRDAVDRLLGRDDAADDDPRADEGGLSEQAIQETARDAVRRALREPTSGSAPATPNAACRARSGSRAACVRSSRTSCSSWPSPRSPRPSRDGADAVCR
jgi:hypothetical protein